MKHLPQVVLLFCFVFFARRSQVSGMVNVTDQNLLAEFRSTMLDGISTFPAHRQCSILTTILEQSGEDVTQVANKLLSKINHSLPCLRDGTMKHEQSTTAINVTAVQQATDIHITKLFNRLPQTYRCLLLLDITRKASKIKSALVTTNSLHKTTDRLSKKLLLFGNTAKCIPAFRGISRQHNTIERSKPATKSAKIFIRLGVRLRKYMPLKLWLKRFKNKLPIIYIKYATKTGKITKYVKNWKRGESKPAVVPDGKFIVNIQGVPLTSNNVVILTFSFLSRTDRGEYIRVDGKEVSAAINSLRRSQLNSILQAEVIGSSALAGTTKPTYNPQSRMKQLSDGEIENLQELFPRYLMKHFKTLSAFDRCYVLKQIGSELNQHLFVVEKLYHSLGLLHKRYFCSRASEEDLKQNISRKNKASVWREIDKLCQSSKSRVPPTANINSSSGAIQKTRPFNAMELVMFALLGFLCLLILVFVANCVVFTFKTRRLTSKYNEKTLNPAPEDCNGNEKDKLSETQLEYFNKHIYDSNSTIEHGGSLSVAFSERDYEKIYELDHEVERICEHNSEGRLTIYDEDISLFNQMRN